MSYIHYSPGNPEVVSHINSLTRPNLVLPLRGHHLSIATSNLDSSIDTGLVVSLHYLYTHTKTTSLEWQTGLRGLSPKHVYYGKEPMKQTTLYLYKYLHNTYVQVPGMIMLFPFIFLMTESQILWIPIHSCTLKWMWYHSTKISSSRVLSVPEL